MQSLSHIQFAGIVPPLRRPAARELLPRPISRRAAVDSCLLEGAVKPEIPRDALVDWILERAGLEPAAYRPAAMRRRVPACLRRLGAPTADAARRVLQREPRLLDEALDSLLIGVTEFFRDRAVFDYLAAAALPGIIARRGGARVLSAGASDGHELCSVALLLANAGVIGSSDLLGIDCRSQAIERARAFTYRLEEVRKLDPDAYQRWFIPSGGNALLRLAVARRMRWEVADLLTFHDRRGWDIVLFRNVAIYMTAAHAQRAWLALAAQLEPGGLLITGKAEHPPEHLPFVRLAASVYQKLEED